MIREELPLILFTLLVQLGLGAVLVAALLSFRLKEEESAPVIRRLALIAALALVVAMGLSLFHLGNPLGAVRALRNLGSSWLSREILFTGLFVLAAAITAWMAYGKKPVRSMLIVTVVAGILSDFATGQVYMATIRPAWSTFFTPVSFFTAALAIGVALGVVTVLPSLKGGSLAVALRDLAVLGSVAVAIQLVALPVYTSLLGSGNAPAQQSVAALTGPYLPLLITRLLAGVVGVGALVVGARSLVRTEGKGGSGLLLLSAAGLLAAEVLARALFYATGFAITVG